MAERSVDRLLVARTTELLGDAPPWLKLLTIIVLVVGPVEAFAFAPGSLGERAFVAAVSVASVGLGIFAVIYVLGVHYVLSIWLILPKWAKCVHVFARIAFRLGPVGSVFGLILLPFAVSSEKSIVFAPVGVGYAWGARWVYRWYHRRGGSSGEG